MLIKKKQNRILTSIVSMTILICLITPVNAAMNTPTDTAAFDSWKTGTWDGAAQYDTGKIVLTPGNNATEMNFGWYSETKGTPQIKLSKNSGMTDAQTFTGTAADINRTNGNKNYLASNKITATGLNQNTTYYYTYSTDGTNWSSAESFNTQGTSSVEMIVVGDPQIGASDGSNGIDIANDTYQWNKTLESALTKYPDINFIFSMGDQINQSSDGSNGGVTRELEYAGFLYPQYLRNYPLATAIGNHESKSVDYSLHYNNPNAQSDLGDTASGGDHYFNYGKVLFIVLNSNNRNIAEHDQLITKAIADPESKNSKWKVVVFHHDIYGSGEPHSDVDGANLRALFAPLMDKYSIDVCLTGHDHSYARSYQIIDGKAIAYQQNSAVNPQGTLYIATNSATGSKYYALNTPKQYFISERNQEYSPNYSLVKITDTNFTITTVNVNNNTVVDQYSITKNATKESLLNLISDANGVAGGGDYTTKYTADSRAKLDKAITDANALLETNKDGVPADLVANYDEENQGDNVNDKLNYYGYADTANERLEAGYAPFLDKTMDNGQSTITENQISTMTQTLSSAMSALVEVSNDGDNDNNGDNDNTDDNNNNDDNGSTGDNTDDNTNTEDNSNSGNDSGNNTTNDTNQESPKTGDNTDSIVLAFFVLIICSAALVGVIRFKKISKLS